MAPFFAPLRRAFFAPFLPFLADRFAAVLRAGARFLAPFLPRFFAPFFALRRFAAFFAGVRVVALRFAVFRFAFFALRAGFFGPGIVAPPNDWFVVASRYEVEDRNNASVSASIFFGGSSGRIRRRSFAASKFHERIDARARFRVARVVDGAVRDARTHASADACSRRMLADERKG
ncbi:MAG TPA: hypothetical protein VMN78_08670 [Longimicrobiales bacterium]|nr:hypothetical protein [Longimicrobiales bacterium]